MKKILIILGLCLSVLSYGQIPASYGAISSSGAASIYTTQYQAVLDAMTTDPTGDTLTWQNTLTYSLDTAGIWDVLDILYIFATTDNGASEALINWIDPGTYDGTAIDAPVWTKRQGYTGDGSADYISSYNPSSEATNYALNDASIFFYLRTSALSGTHAGGSTDGTNSIYFLPYLTNAGYLRVNSGTSISYAANGTNAGFYLGQRTASDATGAYINNVEKATGSAASTSIPNLDIYILARNESGTAGSFLSDEIAIFGMGGSLTASQRASLNTIFETYMDHLGTGVQ